MKPAENPADIGGRVPADAELLKEREGPEDPFPGGCSPVCVVPLDREVRERRTSEGANEVAEARRHERTPQAMVNR